jgi:aspartate/methionine/tyrosine aminotransferase
VKKPVSKFAFQVHNLQHYVVGALNDMPGVECPVPAGAFYAFPDISSFGMTRWGSAR